MQQHELIRLFISPLEKSGIPYMVTGSVAAIFYGEPRLTHDIDMVIHLKEKDIPLFCSLFNSGEYYCPPAEIIQVELHRKSFAHFNIIHTSSGLKADYYPYVGNEFHAWGFEHKKRIKIDGNGELWLAPMEYVIVRKLQYFRDGGSEKHISDIKNMLTQNTDLNADLLKGFIVKFGLVELWKKCQGKS